MNTSKFLNVKIKHVPKGTKGAAPTQVNLADLVTAGGVVITTLDQYGNPLSPQPDPTTVTGALTVDAVAAAAGVTVSPIVGNSLGFNLGGITPAEGSGGSVIALAGTETWNDGSYGPFNAPLGVLCNLPTPPPPIPASIVIVLA